MRTVKLQGRAATLRDHHRAIAARPSSYGNVDFEALRSTFAAREFVGPMLPAHMHRQMQPDAVADRDSRLYWKLAADFKRFGRVDFSSTGTPWVGDAFGFGQSINEVYA